MSKAEEIFKKLKEDEGFQAQLTSILDGKKEDELTKEDAEKIAELAKQYGYDLNEIKGELSDDDIAEVSGGAYVSEGYIKHVLAGERK